MKHKVIFKSYMDFYFSVTYMKANMLPLSFVHFNNNSMLCTHTETFGYFFLPSPTYFTHSLFSPDLYHLSSIYVQDITYLYTKLWSCIHNPLQFQNMTLSIITLLSLAFNNLLLLSIAAFYTVPCLRGQANTACCLWLCKQCQQLKPLTRFYTENWCFILESQLSKTNMAQFEFLF